MILSSVQRCCENRLVVFAISVSAHATRSETARAAPAPAIPIERMKRRRSMTLPHIIVLIGRRVGLDATIAFAAGPASHQLRFTPQSGHRELGSICPLCAKSGQTHRSKKYG